MGKRLKKRGERVMERALGEDDGGDDEVLYITRQADDLGPVSARTERTMTGQQDLRTAPIEEADEPPLNYGSGSGTLHRREIAELDARRGSV